MRDCALCKLQSCDLSGTRQLNQEVDLNAPLQIESLASCFGRLYSDNMSLYIGTLLLTDDDMMMINGITSVALYI
jgi:hypothetical protein